ncbi:MAG: hypothetical protein B6242_01295 [Anaerolineaceae bacterium 4572_78]|nr:MAG: hypothetical protein B6242_01295 [Anaerolineaceae bacterium 4572_78]
MYLQINHKLDVLGHTLHDAQQLLIDSDSLHDISETITQYLHNSEHIVNQLKSAMSNGHNGNSKENNPLASLSPRESIVLRLIMDGMSTNDICGKLKIAPSTIYTYRNRIMKKLGTKTVPDMVKLVLQYRPY